MIKETHRTKKCASKKEKGAKLFAGCYATSNERRKEYSNVIFERLIFYF